MKNIQSKKLKLHPRNRNRSSYDFEALVSVLPALAKYVQRNKAGVKTIPFADPQAVRLLNEAILKHNYGLSYWALPAQNLCPAIPGRAEYIHHMADLLGKSHKGKIPKGSNIRCLDIGTGASCIYPILGVIEYQWSFIACDIDSDALANAQQLIHENPFTENQVELRLQKQSKHLFKGILKEEERIHLTFCNPPFHASQAEALNATRRKVRGLTKQKVSIPVLNFGGNLSELVYEGGEYRFIQNMITESQAYSDHVWWFSSLVSKQSNLGKLHKVVERVGATQIEVIEIKTGNKQSRILAWSFGLHRR